MRVSSLVQTPVAIDREISSDMDSVRIVADNIDQLVSAADSMQTTIYDKDSNGIVDDAELVNGLTVETAVPINAKFTDTVYDSTAVDSHIADVVGNPHGVTATQVGLGSVDNTADINKPISTATQTALDGKIDDAQVLTDVPNGALFTDTVYDDTTIQAEVDANKLKVDSVVGGSNIVVDVTDPKNPIISGTTGTTAGILSRLFATGDEVVLATGTYYLAKQDDEGTVASVEQQVVVDDDTSAYFGQDFIGEAAVEATTFYQGAYAGFVSIKTSPNDDSQRFTSEVYLAANDGTPIDSGIVGNPVGSLGVKVLTTLDTGLIDLPSDVETSVPLTGILNETVAVAVGQRIRYRMSGAKVGAVGGIITLSLYSGNARNSYIDVPVPVNSDTVLNVSGVTGAAVSDALDALNAGLDTKEPADATILKDADIGVTVEAYDATIVKDADIGVTIQGFDATIVVDADIGVTVQGYDINTVVDAAYVHTDNNLTTILKTNYDTAYTHSQGTHAPTDADNTAINEISHADVLVDADVGVQVQAYDVDTAKTDIAQIYSAPQRATATAEDNVIDFTVTQDYTVTMGAVLVLTVGSITGADGQKGEIIVSDTQNISGFTGFTWLGTVPTTMTGVGVFSYKIVGSTIYLVKVENV